MPSNPAPNALIDVCQRIMSHARSAPDHHALVCGSGAMTYGRLEATSNRLAHLLRGMGAAREGCIGLFMDRTPGFVVAALAVMKTGAAYLPLDPATPADRVVQILTDAGADIVVTRSATADELPAGGWCPVTLDAIEETLAAMPSGPVDVAIEPEDLAYVIYTSGTTGRPKGVEITHGNLAHLIDWHVAAFEVGPADRTSQVAGLGFDAAVWEVWPSLSSGASVHIADELIRRSPQALQDWLVTQRITVGFVPTTLAEPMLQLRWTGDTALRTLLTGGDMLHRRPAPGLPFRLVNNYGPTECTVVATSGPVEPTGDDGLRPSIGRPITAVTALVLDDELTAVEPGEPGELCLAGPMVGRGYRRAPELTSRAFVTVAPPGENPVRAYRTGDRVRQLSTGELAFLGRVDEQMKIRGNRIEPGEIVTWLDRFRGIEASAAALHQVPDGPDGPGTSQLVAYVVVAPGATVTATELRRFLAEQLPVYMIPDCFLRLPELPMTLNGKLDRAQLPAPTEDAVLRLPEGRAAAPVSAVQQELRALVASLLERPTMGCDENFFLLGGHSMLGVQLMMRIRQTFGVKIALRQLFSRPTVAELAEEVERLSARTQVGAGSA